MHLPLTHLPHMIFIIAEMLQYNRKRATILTICWPAGRRRCVRGQSAPVPIQPAHRLLEKAEATGIALHPCRHHESQPSCAKAPETGPCCL